MRLIDARGRLFGLLNLVDAGVIAMVIIMVYGAYLGYGVVSGRIRRRPIEGRVVTPLLLEVVLHHLEPSRVGTIQEGEVERDQHGVVIGRVIALDKAVPDTRQVLFGKASVDVRRVGKVKLPALVWIQGEVQGDAYFFQGRMIGVGEDVALRLPSGTISGVILRSFPAEGVEQPGSMWRWERKIIECYVPEVSSAVIKAIARGDEATDDQGLMAARIVGIRRVSGAMQDPDRGETLHSARLLLEVRCLRMPAGCQNDEIGTVELGHKLHLMFPRYRLQAEVVNVEPAAP